MKKGIILAIIVMLNTFSASESPARNAPGFALYNSEGQLITLSSLVKEKPLVINFFASYCIPCKREIPELLDVEKKYPGRFNLVLISIDREGKEKALEFLRGISVDRDCLLDIYQQTAKRYIPDLKIPAIFLVNTKGSIVFEAVGENRDTILKLEKAIIRLK